MDWEKDQDQQDKSQDKDQEQHFQHKDQEQHFQQQDILQEQDQEQVEEFQQMFRPCHLCRQTSHPMERREQGPGHCIRICEPRLKFGSFGEHPIYLRPCTLKSCAIVTFSGTVFADLDFNRILHHARTTHKLPDVERLDQTRICMRFFVP